VTIIANPLVVFGAELIEPAIERRFATARPPSPPTEGEAGGADQAPAGEAEAEAAEPEETPEEKISHPEPTELSDHVVLIGFGRVGSVIGEALDQAGETYLVIETTDSRIVDLRKRGIEGFAGNAANPDVLALAALDRAKLLAIAIPDAFEAGQIAEQARAANPGLKIVARAHSNAEAQHIADLGANIVVKAEREIARGMVRRLKLKPVRKPEPPPGEPMDQTGSTSTSTVAGK